MYLHICKFDIFQYSKVLVISRYQWLFRLRCKSCKTFDIIVSTKLFFLIAFEGALNLPSLGCPNATGRIGIIYCYMAVYIQLLP